MRTFLAITFFAFLIVSCNQKEISQTENSDEITEQAIPKMAVASFDVEAANHIDQEVEISGIVDHVCKHGGKKLLLVTDGASVHVESETRFEDELIGQEVSLNGIVRELRIDESYCLQMEEDNISKHKEGETNEEDYTHKQEMIKSYRDSMSVSGLEYLSYYSLDFLAFNTPE